MEILYLGPACAKILNYLNGDGNQVTRTEQGIMFGQDLLSNKGVLVSYGYRHVISREIIRSFPNKIINLHISYLPWNRGADPNLWSFLENTPAGVTIHYMDEGIDTGDIIAQEKLFFSPDETLRSTYDMLTKTIEKLFIQIWPDFIRGNIVALPQQKEIGSFHNSRDKKSFEYLLTDGWETPIANLIGKAL